MTLSSLLKSFGGRQHRPQASPRRTRLRLLPLESRITPTAPIPVGSEFQINTTTLHHQEQLAVAMDATGDSVVVWCGGVISNSSTDGDIYAQRYNANGTPQGDEFLVNTYTESGQDSPAVAMDASGSFVVVWTSGGQDGLASSVRGQRYAASGTPQGNEFLVSGATGYTLEPAVAMDSVGNFVVVWAAEPATGVPRDVLHALQRGRRVARGHLHSQYLHRRPAALPRSSDALQR